MQKRTSRKNSPHKENEYSGSGKSTGKPKKKKDGESKRPRKVNGPRGQSQSCHQCRQSIFSSKGANEAKQGQLRVKCSSCTRYWCEKCLENRYGVSLGSLDRDHWKCPVCLGNCNCSLCRRKEGKLATGILTPLAKNAGFSNVSDFLNMGTDDIARCLQWKSEAAKATSSTTPAKKTAREARKRPRRDSCLEQDSSDSPKEMEKNSCTSDKKTMAEVSPSTKQRQEPVDPAEGSTRTSPAESCSKRPRITHPGYCITIVGCKSDLNDPEWVGNGRPVNKEHGGLDVMFGMKWNGPQRVLRSRVVPLNAATQSTISQINRKKSIKRKMASSKQLSVQGRARMEYPTSKKKLLVMETMQQELNQLKLAHFTERKQAKKVRLMTAREEKMRQRCHKRMLLKLERVENRLKLKAAREKLSKAKLLLRDARKAQRAAEKEKKKRELAELVARKKEERRRVCRLSSALTQCEENCKENLLEDSPKDCRLLGIPDLPPLTYLELQVPSTQISSFLYVCDFLHVFSDALKIKHSICSTTLPELLEHPRVFVSICWSLLKAVSEGNEELSSEMKAANCPRKWEGFLHRFLNKGRENGSVVKWGESVSDRLAILELLCDQAVSSMPVVQSIEAACKEVEEIRKQLRRETRSTLDQMKLELKRLCEANACFQEMECVRDTCQKKLEALRIRKEKLLELGRVRTRLQPLGEDRHGRLFWSLQSHQGLVLVEPDSCCHGDGEGKWAVIDSPELHQQFMACLFPSGKREAPLLSNLKKLTLFPCT